MSDKITKPLAGMRVRIDGENTEGTLLSWCEHGGFIDIGNQVVGETWDRIAAVLEPAAIEECRAAG